MFSNIILASPHLRVWLYALQLYILHEKNDLQEEDWITNMALTQIFGIIRCPIFAQKLKQMKQNVSMSTEFKYVKTGQQYSN